MEQAIEDINRLGFSDWLLDVLVVAYLDARKNKRRTYDEHNFEMHWMEDILRLHQQILEKRYRPSASVSFVVFDPMVREIFAAPFVDRVVHHFLYLMQGDWWDRRLIHSSYSCRPGKGTLFAIRDLQKKMRSATEGGTKKAYIIKLDISGYFMSLPRKELYLTIKQGLDKQFAEYKADPAGYRLYRTCDYLWRQILMDDPASKAWKRGCRKHWDPEVLPRRKSLFHQKPGKGIVIGNYTSQLASNIYLDRLDRFVTMELGYKYYGRYVDDFFIIVREEEYEQAKRDVAKIEEFLRDELGLVLHPRKRYFGAVDRGVEFVGGRVYLNAIVPSDRVQQKFRKATMDVAYEYKQVENLIPYLGIMKHMNAEKFVKKVFDDMGWRTGD